MDKDLVDLSFLNSPNLHLIEGADGLQAMEMVFQSESGDVQPMLAPGGSGMQLAGSSAGRSVASVAGPALEKMAPASVPGVVQVAPPSARGTVQMSPASALLDQLLSAPVPGDAMSGPAAVLSGPRVVEPAAARGSGTVQTIPAPLVPQQLPVVTRGPGLPVITIAGAKSRLEPAPRPRTPSKVVIVKPKSNPVTVPTRAPQINKKVFVVGPKVGRSCGPAASHTARSAVPLTRILPRSTTAGPATTVTAAAPAAAAAPSTVSATSAARPVITTAATTVPASPAPASAAAPAPAASAVVQKISLTGVRAQVVMVGGKERIVLYRQPGTDGRPSTVAVAAAGQSSTSSAPGDSGTARAADAQSSGGVGKRSVSRPLGQAAPAGAAPATRLPDPDEPPDKLPRLDSSATDVGNASTVIVTQAAPAVASKAVVVSKTTPLPKVDVGTVAVAPLVKKVFKPGVKPGPKNVIGPKSVTRPVAKPVVLPSAVGHTTTPAPEVASTPQTKPSGSEPAQRVISVRIANGCVTATSGEASPAAGGAVVGAIPPPPADGPAAVRVMQNRLQRVMQNRLQRTTGSPGAPLHSLRPPPPQPGADEPLVVDDGTMEWQGDRTVVPAAVPAPAAAADIAQPGPLPRVSVDQLLQRAVSEIFDCVDEAAAGSQQEADMVIDGLVRQVESSGGGVGGVGSSSGGAMEVCDASATMPLLSQMLQQTTPDDQSQCEQMAGSVTPVEPPPPAPTVDPAAAVTVAMVAAATATVNAMMTATSGANASESPSKRQRRRKDVLKPIMRASEPVPEPPPCLPSPPTPPPREAMVAAPYRPPPPSPSPEPGPQPLVEPRQLVELVEDLCTTDGLGWSWSGFSNIGRKKRKDEKADPKGAQLYLNEFGVVELVCRATRQALVLSRTASGGATGGLGPRRPDTACCCAVCGCYGCLADFYGDGECCSKICYDVSTGREAIRKKKMNLLGQKANSFPSLKGKIKAEPKLSPIKAEPPKDVKDHQLLVYGPVGSFSWSVYLSALTDLVPSARAAPDLLDAERPPRPMFRPGHRLEAVDPRHPRLVCVCTVAEVVGARLRLHLDGYSVRHDFWVQSDSRDIFPCGWTDQHRTDDDTGLQPPPGHTPAGFVWADYMREQRDIAAPAAAFACVADEMKPFQRVEWSDLRAGQRLEAADPAHPRHVRPARVAQVRAGRLLVEFDGDGESPGFWADLSSPRLRPVTWGEENGVPVLPPSDWPAEEGPFRWQKHLVRTRSLPVPSRLFRARLCNVLQPQMRVEAVDVRVPSLVRVMHVLEVSATGLVRLRPDGWRRAPDQWLPLDPLDHSSGVHAPGWCRKTGHPLTPPVTRAQADAGCPERGCAGLGHIDGPRYRRHATEEECPYRDEQPPTPDRLTGEPSEEENLNSLDWPPLPPAPATPPPPAEPAPKPPRKTVALYRDISSIASEVTSVVFDKEAPKDDRRGVWPRCAALRAVDRFLAENRAVHLWGADTVVSFLRQFSTTADTQQALGVFREEEIDGEALLLLTRDDLCSLMKLRLGTANKVHNCIVRLRKHFNYRGQMVGGAAAGTVSSAATGSVKA